MNLIFKTVIAFLSIVILSASYAGENTFYVLRHHTSSQSSSLKNHYHSIGMIISQAYQVDQNGKVWGHIDPDVADFVKNHGIKLMVMVTNVGFDKERAHQFLIRTAAQQRAIQSIISACNQNHYYGVQFDFEMIPLNDKKALTRFLTTAAAELHKKGFIVSFAVAPLVSDNPQPSEFLKRSYAIWEGAYDLKALGESADFLTIMTYDQHTHGTTPGPTASFPWAEQAIKHTLKFVSSQKISLGIASYSSYWYTGTSFGSPGGKLTLRMREIDYSTVKSLLQKNHVKLRWDEMAKINYAAYEHHWLDEYIFVENAKSLQAKLKLVKKYHLRGVSVFRLGIEDPKIWET